MSAPGFTSPPHQSSEVYSAPTPIEGPFEVLRARAFVESAVAEEAARRAKPEDIARLDAILAEVGGPALSIEHWVALDRSFHRAVVATLGNVVLLRTVGELFDQRINPYFAQLARHIENDSTWRAAHVEHVAIRDAIAAHRPADARAAMHEHLERSHRRFSRDFGEAPFVHEEPPGQARAHGGGPAARQGHQSVQDTQRAAQGGRLLAIGPGLAVPAHIGGEGMADNKLTRRRFVATTAAASATTIAAPFVRTAHAAGKLTVGFWDHWVPGCQQGFRSSRQRMGGEGEGRGVTIDYVTSQGSKNLLTIAAESQAKSGHDIIAMPTWWPQDQARNLEPVDDIMAELIKLNGKVNGDRRVSGTHRRPLAGRARHASAARSRVRARASIC